MEVMTLFSEPAILVIISVFITFIVLVLTSYIRVNTNLKNIFEYLRGIAKKELSYKFKQLDEYMKNNNYVNVVWEDFKKALIFPEKIYIATHNSSSQNEVQSDIYLTMDASYFFNDDSLITSKINYKFIQIMPTLLTGLGPFFTFLKMAIAFTAVNFSSEANISESLSGLMQNIQLAALCSVFAVGFSLCFMFFEKILYASMCKKYCLKIQQEFSRLFNIVTSEKFLIDLVKESKIQNANNEKIMKSLPTEFSKAISNCISDTTVPYLENILYSLNRINESLNKGNDGDMVDKLF